MTSKHLAAVAAAATTALAAAGCGGSSVAADGTDRAFAQQMVPHHASAVDMAQIGLERAQSSFVRDLSADIIRSQRTEIGELRTADRRLAQDGVKAGDLGSAQMAGMHMDAASLRTAEPFDRAFLRMMVPHHEGAIAMARAELARGEDPELRGLATRIVRAQEQEIRAMRGRLARG